MTSYLIFGVAYGLAAAVQPGPFQTFLVSGSAGIIILAAGLGRFGPRPRRVLAVLSALALAALGLYQVAAGLVGKF